VLDWTPQVPDIDDIVASAWGWHRRRWGLDDPTT